MVLSCHKEMVMPQRVPIRDLKHTANISALCHESKERLFSAAKIARLKNATSLLTQTSLIDVCAIAHEFNGLKN